MEEVDSEEKEIGGRYWKLIWNAERILERDGGLEAVSGGFRGRRRELER